MNIVIKGLTPLLMNRDSIMFDDSVEPRNTKTETYPQFEERIWRQKAHTNDEGVIIFPAIWLRKALIASQGLNANPIKPPNARRASATLKQNFVSGIMIMDNYPIIGTKGKPITIDDLVPHKCMVSPQKGKVLCIRPQILLPWSVDIVLEISDLAISEQNVLECLRWVGRYNGVGDWRPQKGGMFGGFEIKN